MISGVVNDRLQAVVELPVSSPTGRVLEVEAVVDTGFNGFLTLPPTFVADMRLPKSGTSKSILANGAEDVCSTHDAMVVWDGQVMSIEIDASGPVPLVGMALLEGHNLNIDVHSGGSVRINSAPPA